MANRFWVGGTGTWSTVLTTNWSTSSGGAGGASVPTSADTVIFDALSGGGTCTVSGTVVCGDLDMSAAPVMSFAVTGSTVSIGGAANGFVTLGANVTYSGGRYQLTSTSTNGGAGWPITSNGKTFNGLTINGIGGKWTLQDANIVAADLTLTNGTLDTNNKNCTWLQFLSTGTTARGLTFGTSTITINGTSGTVWSLNGTSLTASLGSSTVIISGTFPNFTQAGTVVTFGTVNFTALAGGFPTAGFTPNNCTFGNLSFANSAASTSVTVNGNCTVTGTFTATGVSQVSRIMFYSATMGSTRTFTAAAVSLTNVDFRDIAGAGAAIPFTGTSLGNGYGNSNITFTAPTTRYWVGGTGNWNNTARWSASSGGATGATMPLLHDSVIFDGSSGTGVATMNVINVGADLDFTSYTGSFTNSTSQLYIYGSLTIGTGATSTAGTAGPFFVGRGTHTINTNGRNPGNSYFIDCLTGSYTLASNMTYSSGGNCQFNSGTLDFNGFNFTGGGWNFNSALAKTLNMGSGTISCSSTAGTMWNVAGTSMTINAGTSTLVLTDVSATAKTFAGGSKTYYNLQITGGGAGAITFTGSNTFNTIQVLGGTKSLIFTAGTTQTFLNQTSYGNGTNIITMTSTTPGSQYNFSRTSGLISADYLNLTDSNATGGATWHAGPNSTNVSNNTGWFFGGLTQNLSDSVVSSDALVKAIGKPQTDSTTSSDALIKQLAKLFTDSTTESDSPAKTVTTPRGDTTTSTDNATAAAAYRRSIADADTAADVLSYTYVNGVVTIQEVAITVDTTANNLAVSTPANNNILDAGAGDVLDLSSPANNKTIQSSSNSVIIVNEVT